MSQKVSAGLFLCRCTSQGVELLLGHPGGPFFRRKDAGVWTCPKGLVNEGEALLDAARREFEEETGSSPPQDAAAYHQLGKIRQRSGKVVHAWAFVGDVDPERLRSNSFELEWPPKSGRMQRFFEIDRFAFFGSAAARKRILPAQLPFVDGVDELAGRGELCGS